MIMTHCCSRFPIGSIHGIQKGSKLPSVCVVIDHFGSFSSSNNKWTIDLTTSLLVPVAFWKNKGQDA